MSNPDFGYVSSSIVREIASMGEGVELLVPPNVQEHLKSHYSNR
jgi:pantetheine-phosphate adenylyltransferase